MSSYQYYDFYAIDKVLNRKELAEVKALSSRGNPTTRRASFLYHYSDFRHNEEEVLVSYFDIMLYAANWGNRRLLMKFPKELVSISELRKYDISINDDIGSEVRIFKKGDFVIIDFNYLLEDGYWLEAEGMLDNMIPIREQILNGDYRALFMGWLHLAFADTYGTSLGEDTTTPPIPLGMNKLNYSLENFANFWEMDRNLVEAAGKWSTDQNSTTKQDLSSQIPSLSQEEKELYLNELLDNEVKTKQKLTKRLKELLANPADSTPKMTSTLGEIKSQALVIEDQKKAASRLAAEKAKLAKMKKIEKAESQMWKEVVENLSLKSARGYEDGVKIVADLKEFYDFKNAQVAFDNNLETIVMEKYGKSVALKRRLKAVGVIK